MNTHTYLCMHVLNVGNNITMRCHNTARLNLDGAVNEGLLKNWFIAHTPVQIRAQLAS